jgi:hypothetical protein
MPISVGVEAVWRSSAKERQVRLRRKIRTALQGNHTVQKFHSPKYVDLIESVRKDTPVHDPPTDKER